MTRPSKQSKDVVKDRLLDKLDEVMEAPTTSVRDVLKAIELYGKEFGLFIEQRNIKIDVNTVVRQLSDRQLKTLSGEVGSDSDVIDVQSWPHVEQDTSDGNDSEPVGTTGGEDATGVDQGVAGEDRKEA